MKHFLLFFFLVTSVLCFSQSKLDTVFVKYNISDIDTLQYKTDTVIFPSTMRRNMLIGTTIWTGSSNLYNSYYENGLELISVKSSDCLGQVEELDSIKKGITEIITKDSTWIIKCNIADNCCYSFLCDIQVVNETILNLNFNGYGTHCDCDCYFELTFTIDRIDYELSKKIKFIQLGKQRIKIKNAL